MHMFFKENAFNKSTKMRNNDNNKCQIQRIFPTAVNLVKYDMV